MRADGAMRKGAGPPFRRRLKRGAGCGRGTVSVESLPFVRPGPPFLKKTEVRGWAGGVTLNVVSRIYERASWRRGVSSATCERGKLYMQWMSLPCVSGDALVGATLSLTPAGWTEEPTSLSFAWTSDETPIPGAEAATYVVAAEGAGHWLACRAIGDGGDGITVETPSVLAG